MVKTEQLRLEKAKQKEEQLERERHADWLQLQKERAARKTNAPERPFPRRADVSDAEGAAEAEKRRERILYSDFQRQQAEARREAQRKEAEEMRVREGRRVAENQRRFDESIERLQTLVPPGLEIKVPKYQPRSSLA
jgi:hypothetical protein